MKKLLVLTLAVGVCTTLLVLALLVQTPQTTVRASTTTRYPALRLLALISGVWTPLQVGPGIILNTATNPPTLGVAVASLPIPAVESYPITAAASTLTAAFVPAPNTMLCFKNGVLMSQGNDYTLAGAVLTFSPDASGGPGNAPAPGDLFTLAYWH